MSPIRTIVHPTDFSDASAEAFAHALRIALAEKSTLYLLHVAIDGDEREWAKFPHVRATLARWGLLDEGASADAVGDFGIRVAKPGLTPHTTVTAILHFLASHSADLIVLATEDRQGVARWLHGSVAEQLARHAKVPTLFVPARAPGFIDPERGDIHIRHMLVPIDHHPKPTIAVEMIAGLVYRLAGDAVEGHFLHVGRHAPRVQRNAGLDTPPPVTIRDGNVVEAILNAAGEWPADLIGMPTAGHHGFLDALRGTTSERVLRQAPCPILTVPAFI
jgi:nucleotide-binding universal stress UspA family protein